MLGIFVVRIRNSHFYVIIFRLKSLGQSVNLPERKGDLTQREQNEKKLYETMLEFSLGPVGTAAGERNLLAKNS